MIGTPLREEKYGIGGRMSYLPHSLISSVSDRELISYYMKHTKSVGFGDTPEYLGQSLSAVTLARFPLHCTSWSESLLRCIRMHIEISPLSDRSGIW